VNYGVPDVVGWRRSRDLPPRAECAPAWRAQLLAQLPNLRFTLVIGQYAHAYHLKNVHASLTDTVRTWREYGPDVMPLPHPSPRNNIWLSRNSWFADEVLPSLRARVSAVLLR
jgi:uracil-DNA glycosylase